MAQKELELILTRQLADYLAVPIFIVDPAGTLVFYNEPAERLLGKRFNETGEMPAAEWSTMFAQEDEAGKPILPEEIPLMIAHTQRRPAHRTMWISGLDKARHQIDVTAFPLVGLAGRRLGSVAVFWESGKGPGEAGGWPAGKDGDR